MRVLESDQLVAMTKKRHKLRKQKRDNEMFNESSDDTTEGAQAGRFCEHISKAVNISNVKKAVKQVTLGECPTCKKDCKSKDKGSVEEPTSAQAAIPDDIEITIWCCLQCGHQGCDRNSPGQHALKHFETPHSSQHAVVLNLNNWAVWCYDCDDDITIDSNRKLTECVEFVQKQTGAAAKTDRPPSGKKKEKEVEMAEKQNITAKPSSTMQYKVKGLNNLGNTCFFNAVMQNMNQTHVLEPLMSELCKKGKSVIVPQELGTDRNMKHEESKLPPLSVVLPEAGSLTSAMMFFLKLMNEPGKSIVSPRLLFNQVCQKAPRFKGYQQQDSHELLRYLLDGMRLEEVKRMKEGILKVFGLPVSINPKSVEEDKKHKIKVYGQNMNMTFVDSVFGGQLISTVLCEECHLPSIVYEQFLDLSLPITEAKVWPGKSLFSKAIKKGSTSSMRSLSSDRDSQGEGVFLNKTEEPSPPSKHQMKAAKKKAKKEAKLNKKKSKILVLDEVDKKDSQSENDNLLKDPNDADSETSIDRREHPMRPDLASRDSSVSSINRVTSLGQNDDSLQKGTDEPSAGDCDLAQKDEVVSRTKDTEIDQMQCTPDAILVNGVVDDEDDAKVTEEYCCDADKQNSDAASQCASECTASQHANDSINDVVKNMEDVKITAKEAPLPNGDAVEIGNGDCVVSHKDTKPEIVLEDLGAVGGQDIESDDEVVKKAVVPLANRYQSSSRECSVQSCLGQFTTHELLTGNNKFGCESCTKKKYADVKKDKFVYTNANKQLLIHRPPPILTLHLKRFQQAGYSLRKVNRHVDFPLTLDIAPFCSENCKDVADSKNQILYSLYGLVEHSGRLQGGHYTAYVKVRQPSQRLIAFVQLIQNGKRANKSLNKNKDQHNNESKSDTNGQDVAMATEKPVQEGNHDTNSKDDEKVDSTHNMFVDFEPPSCPAEGKWFYISDTHVSEVTEAKVLNSQAYVLFYERML
ncbi:ubiquitin carboxyl-terminal hydrolase 16-like [Saccoglossus kowalevskii]|uniref:Ubiquitin carboxyl-terminal hydrolase n=1 Tax=Saccoglossus kowalevskii TaxID=10224 RepID=A0ABM0M0X8_SACKO|nr:PREDICTED: ubiquitin carboxyl-terminal hydrolase 16-like [Saccoglossus kowalevskii]